VLANPAIGPAERTGPACDESCLLARTRRRGRGSQKQCPVGRWGMVGGALPARQEVRLHFHGVAAEDVAAILAHRDE